MLPCVCLTVSIQILLFLNLITIYRSIELFTCMPAYYLGHISLKTLYYKLNKNEVFHLYVLSGASLGHQALKFLC